MAVSYHQSKRKYSTKKLLTKTNEDEMLHNDHSSSTAPFYVMMENIQRGILPHNDEIKSWISSIRTSGVLQSSGMSDAGQKLFKDLAELLTVFEKVLEAKNKDEIFQRFLYHARLATRIATDDFKRTGKITIVKGRNRRVYLGGTKEERIRKDFRTARKSARGNIRSLYNVLQLLLTSSVFRDVILDSQRLIKNALANEQHPLETVVMPVITESSYMTAPLYTSSLEDLKKRIDVTSIDLEKLSLQASQKQESVPVPKNENVENLENINLEPSLQPLSKNIPSVSIDKTEKLPIVTHAPRMESTEGIIEEGSKNFEKPTYSRITSEHPQRVPTPISPTKETRDLKMQRKDYIDCLVDDLKALLGKICSSPDFKHAMNEMYRFIVGIQQVPDATREPVVPRELRYEANFQQAQRDLLHILERFANNSSLDPTIRALKSIRLEASKDYKLKDFIGDWTSYLTRSIQDPNYLEHEEFRNRGRFLFERTREFHSTKYRPMFDDAFNALKGFSDGWARDEYTNQLGQQLNRIFRADLIGQPDVSDRAPGLLILNLIKPDLFNDFRNVLLPSILRQLHDVPLPRIEAIYGGNRLVLENLVLPGDAFLPMDFEMKAKSKLKLHPKSRVLGQLSSKLEEDKGWMNGLNIRIANIKTSVRDVKFTFDHPDNFPKIQDAGLADIHIGGTNGLNINVHILSDARDVTFREEHRTKIYPHYVRVSIDNLRVRLHHSTHDTAYMFLSPIINYSLKKSIETAIKDRIVNSIFFLDDAINRLTNRS